MLKVGNEVLLLRAAASLVRRPKTILDWLQTKAKGNRS